MTQIIRLIQSSHSRRARATTLLNALNSRRSDDEPGTMREGVRGQFQDNVRCTWTTRP